MRLLYASFVLLLTATPLVAQGPDVIVSNTGGIANNGTVGGITAYSLASTSCNIGDMEAIWTSGNNQHPVIAGNIYRLKDGLMEQVGMSWLKHGFCAVNEFSCGPCQTTPCSTLGLNCADTYGTGLNGSQGNLGPRSDVNASTGEFTYPFPTQGQSGNDIFKRCQVPTDTINPTLNPGALYFGVVQYVCTDEAAWGTQYNNNSYRRLVVGPPASGGWNLSYTGSTVQQQDPIHAWQNNATGVDRVVIVTPEVAGGGQMVLGTRVEDLGGGMYRYQYALFNNNSDRSARSFSVPIPPGIALSNLHFHDVDYHSGEPYSGTDWEATISATSITWSTQTFAENANANALRWGTTYSFSFDAPAAPISQAGSLGFFKPGPGDTAVFLTVGPDGDFTDPVTDLDCFYSDDAVQLVWQNGEAYDSIAVRRDGVEIATLPGTATSFEDPDAAIGFHTYALIAEIGGAPSGQVSCLVEVPMPPPLGFDLEVSGSLSLTYDLATGIGSCPVPLGVSEDPTNPDYPNAIHGVGLSLSSDADLLSPSAALPGAAVAGLNGGSGPEFFAPAFYSDGFTLGCVLDFAAMETIVATGFTEIVVVTYDANSATLAGDPVGATTSLIWQDGLGPVPVINTVVLAGTQEIPPGFVSGSVTLAPGSGGLFLRGDDNGDGVIGLLDPIYSLNYQFVQGPSVCLDAMDFNDNELVGLDDVVANLGYQFLNGPPPTAPFPACGTDPGGSALGCDGPAVCP